MPNSKIKIIYSLRVHIALQKRGFTPIMEMKNPQVNYLNCWVYEQSPEFIHALNAIMEAADD